MTDKIYSIKHKVAQRVSIPSKEEAGYEDANALVQSGKSVLDLPLNPVTIRGQDPELCWMNKYGNDDREELLRVDIRSLYRHEHIEPDNIIKNLYRLIEDDNPQTDLFGSIESSFKDMIERDELEKVAGYYSQKDGWKNRLIQGDSHLVMASLLEREGMARQVQMIYMDPPYGIKYGSNWQIKLNNREVKDGSDDHLTGEPEVVKAFRDTWELGIHSYLSYLRDRLLLAKELLNESGSCFIQISDENVHLVRSVMDEVFGSENFVGLIAVTKTAGGLTSVNRIPSRIDYLIWYAKRAEMMKYRQLYESRADDIAAGFNQLLLPDDSTRAMTKEEKEDPSLIPEGARVFRSDSLTKPGPGSKYEIDLNGKRYNSGNRWWGSPKESILRLIEMGRVRPFGNTLRFVKFYDDFPYKPLNNLWDGLVGAKDIKYVVQTNEEIVRRCLLMATDPGDLVLDPTCGSGTTAFVAEQLGRRWITTDTSRIALNIAKTRMMTAVYPYFKLYDEISKDVRQGFVYKTAVHITLSSLANDEPPATETLYDKPEVDMKKMRVSGPFTVETLQNFEPTSPEDLAEQNFVGGEKFEKVIQAHLEATGIKNGRSEEHTMFRHVEMQGSENLHGYGFYLNGEGERKAYFHVGPKFGTVSKKAVNAAIRECQTRGDAQWLVILGFSFESDIEGGVQHTPMGNFTITRVRIHDDLLQEGLKKKPSKSAASFVTIGEPEIKLKREADIAIVEIQGLDIYDPIKDEIKARDLHDIAYWMVDDNYDGSNFVVRQIFFCGGEKDEFSKWKKGLHTLAVDETRRRAERTLRIEIDEDAFDRVYGYLSHPIKVVDGQKIAVRVTSQFGEESTKVLEV
jgi:adenine-specific DNA-methyltransferase